MVFEWVQNMIKRMVSLQCNKNGNPKIPGFVWCPSNFTAIKGLNKTLALVGIEPGTSGSEMVLTNAQTTEPRRLDKKELKSCVFE